MTTNVTSSRRFEFVAGNSSKFWEIQVTGNEVQVRFGRIGSDGQIHARTFPDEATAVQHAEKMVKEKTDKGYAKVG